MDGGGSEKDEDKFSKNSTVTAVVKKPEPEAAAPTGNGTIEEELATEIIAKEKSQGSLLQFHNVCIMFM
jgi:hypothetical protein